MLCPNSYGIHIENNKQQTIINPKVKTTNGQTQKETAEADDGIEFI